MPRYIPKKIKTLVAKRANYCCEYCQCPNDYVPVPFAMEHILPIVKGGTNATSNLAYACSNCNGAKHAKVSGIDNVTNTIIQLFHPRKHKWKEHFHWNDDFTLITGITAIGRVTIKELKLNRDSIVNLRIVLYLHGEHPPKHTM